MPLPCRAKLTVQYPPNYTNSSEVSLLAGFHMQEIHFAYSLSASEHWDDSESMVRTTRSFSAEPYCWTNLTSVKRTYRLCFSRYNSDPKELRSWTHFHKLIRTTGIKENAEDDCSTLFLRLWMLFAPGCLLLCSIF